MTQGEPSVGDNADADIGTGLVAHNLTDMHTFISLADFVCGILPECGADRFQNWAHLVTLDLVAGSGQRPLLSSFYRMLTVTMKLTSAAMPKQGPASTTGSHEVAYHGTFDFLNPWIDS